MSGDAPSQIVLDQNLLKIQWQDCRGLPAHERVKILLSHKGYFGVKEEVLDLRSQRKQALHDASNARSGIALLTVPGSSHLVVCHRLEIPHTGQRRASWTACSLGYDLKFPTQFSRLMFSNARKQRWPRFRVRSRSAAFLGVSAPNRVGTLSDINKPSFAETAQDSKRDVNIHQTNTVQYD